MKITSAFLGAAFVFTASASGALATTYDFSYMFAGDGQGQSITGSFTGTGPITDINVDKVLGLTVDGATLTGPFSAWTYTAPSGGGNYGPLSAGGAIVSSDSSKSDFFFEVGSATPGATAYFYVVQPWYNPTGSSSPLADQYSNGAGAFVNYYNGQYAPGNFSVQAVPEVSTWAMMLAGFAGLGFVAYRRNKAATLAA